MFTSTVVRMMIMMYGFIVSNDHYFYFPPQFQIDGNLGYVAAISEMLVQSHIPGQLLLLPAVPSSLAERGVVRGLKARGQVSVSLSWAGGQVTACLLRFDGVRVNETNERASGTTTTTTSSRSAKLVPHPWLLGLREMEGAKGFFEAPPSVHMYTDTGVSIGISSPNQLKLASWDIVSSLLPPSSVDKHKSSSVHSSKALFSNRRNPGSSLILKNKKKTHAGNDDAFWNSQRFVADLTVSDFPSSIALCSYGLTDVACRRELSILMTNSGTNDASKNSDSSLPE